MRARTLAAGVALAASLAACGHGGGRGSADARVSSVAANPTVSADAHAAATLLGMCAKEHPTIGGTEACAAAAVPKATRKAVAKCLATVYAADVEHATAMGAKARARQAWTVFTTSSVPGYSGNLCLPASLR
jgi:hypothetical protein